MLADEFDTSVQWVLGGSPVAIDRAPIQDAPVIGSVPSRPRDAHAYTRARIPRHEDVSTTTDGRERVPRTRTTIRMAATDTPQAGPVTLRRRTADRSTPLATPAHRTAKVPPRAAQATQGQVSAAAPLPTMTTPHTDSDAEFSAASTLLTKRRGHTTTSRLRTTGAARPSSTVARPGRASTALKPSAQLSPMATNVGKPQPPTQRSSHDEFATAATAAQARTLPEPCADITSASCRPAWQNCCPGGSGGEQCSEMDCDRARPAGTKCSGAWMLQFCPATCGLCPATTFTGSSKCGPKNPCRDGYRCTETASGAVCICEENGASTGRCQPLSTITGVSVLVGAGAAQNDSEAQSIECGAGRSCPARYRCANTARGSVCLCDAGDASLCNSSLIPRSTSKGSTRAKNSGSQAECKDVAGSCKLEWTPCCPGGLGGQQCGAEDCDPDRPNGAPCAGNWMGVQCPATCGLCHLLSDAELASQREAVEARTHAQRENITAEVLRAPRTNDYGSLALHFAPSWSPRTNPLCCAHNSLPGSFAGQEEDRKY